MGVHGRPLKPLKNEIVSRDQMQKTPPHILVTNYAMLEYMMLRPKDDLVFSRAKLRFLVLDEAHIYRGATGMETSLLLKRLKARISNPANVLHILTSATLGGKEADDDIVKFAETLCNASFYAEDIIRSQSVVPSYDREPVDVPLSMFAELIDPQKPLNVIADDYGLPIPDGIPDAEYLYDLCVSTSVYRDLRRITSHPMTIPEITRALRATHNVTQQDVVNIIGVAAQASKNKSALIKARYHMFAKALEGAYVTLGQNKKLMLNRNRSITIGDENWKVFECAICDDCGRVAVAGKEVDGKLEFANSSYDPEIEYYLLRDSRDIDLDLDEEDEDDTEEIGKNDYILCSKCGALIHESLKADPPCTCGLTHYVKLRKARKSGSRGDGKCPSCNSGTFKTFYLGYDAATAVLGTSLFEELPESEKVLKSNDSLMVVCNDDFYVCPHCGYAESTMENMEVAGFNSHQKTLEKKHITPWGKNCEVKLFKNKLCHVFKTDVVRLVFSTPQAGNQEVMLSVMYALLEALSSVMDIERNDIKGCLHKIVYDNKLIYAIVLYDAVAGGAGHVRRLVTEDGRCFRQVVEKAIAITKGCNCSPSCYSCLRNYYNQKIHDLLNRKYAYDFLENYYGELEPITNEEFENGELYNV